MVKDLCGKCDKGFGGSDIMRSAAQKKEYEKRQSKKEQKGQAGPSSNDKAMVQSQVASRELHNPQQNMGPLGYTDVEGLLASDDYYSEAGRPMYINPKTIPVRAFDPQEMPPDSSSIMFGIRRTGKSFFMRWYYYHWKDYFDQIFVFTGTKLNGFWQQFVPEKFVFDGLDEGRLDDIIAFAKKIHDEPQWARTEGYSERTAVALDDVIAEEGIRRQADHGPLAQLFVLGRHLKMSVSLATQLPTGVPPKVRDNLDFAVFFKQTKNKSKERFADEYMGRLNRKTAFELIELYTKVTDAHTENEKRQCLVVNLSPSLTYNERFMVATPTDPGPFKVGSRKLWMEGGPGKEYPSH